MGDKATGNSARVVDLFCGCGGLTAGFKAAGFEIVAAFDAWNIALDCYKENFSNISAKRVNLADVDFAVEQISPFDPDLIIGGPPCQDFSHAGNRVENDRAELTRAFAEIVTRVLPDFFVMENVPRALASDAYFEAKSVLIEKGYGLTECILDASLYGVPQKRKRLFVIGGRGLPDNHFTRAIQDKEALFSLSVWEKYPDFPVNHYYRHPRNYNRRAVFSIDEPAPTVRGMNRPRPSTYTPHDKDTSKSETIRALSYSERALIQTFPDNFCWPKTNKTAVEQLVGNAVPVKLAEAVAEVIMHWIQHGEFDTQACSFKKWIIEICGHSEHFFASQIAAMRKADRELKTHHRFGRFEEYCQSDNVSDLIPGLSTNEKKNLDRAVGMLKEYLALRNNDSAAKGVLGDEDKL